jgi:M6 family metalloprotease-like protein
MSMRSRALRLSAALALASAALNIAPGPASAAPPADCRLPAPAGIGNEHEGPTDYGRWLRPSGTVRAVVLFVDFPDAQPTAGERTERVNLLSSAPTWVATSSYGRVSTPLTFDGAWRRMPQPQTAYSQYGQSFDAHRAYLRDAVSAADAAVNFSQYQIVYVVPPRSAGALPNSPAFIASPGWGVNADGVELRHGVTFGQDIDFWGAKVVAHETGHLFGLPDLYSYAGGPNIHAAVGGWDLMGLISGPAPDHLAWHKWKMAWLDDAQIVCRTIVGQTTTTLTPLGSSGGTKAVVVRTGSQRAVVVENRQVSPLDVASSCFRPGVLVYVVDASVGGGSNPVTVADRAPGSTVAGCDPAHAQLDNATLTTVGHEVVVSGVRVRLTATSGSNRTVRVTW